MSIWSSGPHKTVVVLGAAASKGSEFSLPTMQGFFGTNTEQIPAGLRPFFEWFYPGRSPADYNLEDVLSYLYISHSRVPAWTGTDALLAIGRKTLDYGLLLDYVADRLEVPRTPCGRHTSLVQRLQAKDSLLSLNYDLVCDNALRALEWNAAQSDFPTGSRLGTLRSLIGKPGFAWGEPVALLPRERERGFYLKLHGSLDWLVCPNRRCQNNARFYSSGLEPITEGQVSGAPCRACGTPLQLFLVPPVATKSIENEGRLAFLWNLALRELVDAIRVIVIGVSFAPSDQELRWLIRQSSALRASRIILHIVNPSMPRARFSAMLRA
jgi:hypothetical protein